jgi:hypothetical protein
VTGETFVSAPAPTRRRPWTDDRPSTCSLASARSLRTRETGHRHPLTAQTPRLDHIADTRGTLPPRPSPAPENTRRSRGSAADSDMTAGSRPASIARRTQRARRSTRRARTLPARAQLYPAPWGRDWCRSSSLAQATATPGSRSIWKRTANFKGSSGRREQLLHKIDVAIDNPLELRNLDMFIGGVRVGDRTGPEE